MRNLIFNGKFTSQTTTGVQRVATELVCALDGLLCENPSLVGGVRGELACPPNSDKQLPLQHIVQAKVGHRHGVSWEQIDLPGYVGDALLVNLCNMGPLRRVGDIIVIHDAQPFIAPQSYTPAFRWWYRTALPLLAARASHVVTVSKFAANALAAWGVASPEKVTIVPNGVDHMLRVEADADIVASLGLEGRPYVLAPSTAQKHKNIAVLLQAFADPRLADVSLVLMGGAGRSELLKAGLHPPAHTVFTGRTSDSQMRALMEQALVFAFPSTTEGFGLPPLEAMLLGAPVVVAPGGALPEVCGDGALYADAADPDAWTAAILHLAQDTAARSALRSAGQKRAQSYRWARSAQALTDLINQRLRG